MTISEVANDGIVDIDSSLVEGSFFTVEVDGCQSNPDSQMIEILFNNGSIEYSGENQDIEYIFDETDIEVILEDETIDVVLDLSECLV